jgi:hypothetical protein
VQSLIKKFATFLTVIPFAFAGPIEFGQQELRAAMNERGLSMGIETEINLDQPETFRVTVVNRSSALRISGGDLRGLMYGLMEAADQIRNTGSMTARSGAPGFAIRSVRIAPMDTDLAQNTFYNSDRWIKFFAMAAKNRINRVVLVLPLERLEYDRIRYLSQLARDYAVDLHIGIRGPLENRPIASYLRKLLDDCVLIRGVEVEVSREPGDYFRSQVFPTIQATGRRVTLDLRGAESRPDVLRAAVAAGVTLAIPARNFTGSQGHPFYTPIPAQGAPNDVEPVRARLAVLMAAMTEGFEIELTTPNLENYERLYWSWGRQGYDYHTPGLTAGKSAPKAKKR